MERIDNYRPEFQSYGRQPRRGYAYSGNGGYYRSRSTNNRKRSGAKIQEREGAVLVSAWRKNRYGFFVLYARPYKGTSEHKTQNGRKYLNLFVTIVNRSTGELTNMSGLYDVEKRKLRLPDLNQVVSNNGAGGYWGISLKRSYSR